MEKIQAKVTQHTRQRAEEFDLTISKIIWMFWHSEEEKLPKDVKKMKKDKYFGNDGVFYRRYGTYIFTVKKVIDKVSGKDIYLILTICNQEINLKTISC
jgi:hypothetical protein